MHGNPTGGGVTHGNATINQNGNVLTINQGTDRLIMGWQTFSIGQGETTRFVQPSSSSMALNRVNGGTRSMIEGRLEANGGVILINPAGITVTKSGVVNVNTFIGSTHDITDDEFLKGGALNFKGTSDASVENLGTIHAETGDIALIARTVRNEGTLSARKGVVGLAAGDEVLYQPNAEERLLVKSQTASASSIHHSGSIQAAAAEIKAAGNPYAVAINLDGIVEARGNATRNIKPRVIVHAAQGDIKVGSTAAISAADENSGGLVKIRAATGNLQLDGKVAANSSMDNGGKGGEIQILGNTITLSGTALLDASGATGGGKIFVGGDYEGGANPTNNYASEPLQNASTLKIDKGAVMNADATVQGDGGVVINWAEGTTVSSGSVSAKGGPLGGNGGFVEISGKQKLGFAGEVNLSATRGRIGTLLLDPDDLWIIGSGRDPNEESVTSQYKHYLDSSSDFYWYNETWVTTAPVITQPLGVIIDPAKIQADMIFSAANVYFTDRHTLTYEQTTVKWEGFGNLDRNEYKKFVENTYDLNPAQVVLS
jgi:filamentous hemagglutinin family protein